MFRFAGAAAAVLLLLAGPAGAEPVVPTSKAEIDLSFAPLVRSAAPAVVNIYARHMVVERANPLFDDPFFQRFFGDDMPGGRPRQRVENSLGSGVLVGSGGLVVTNHHVIKDADQITVVLSDRTEYEAELVLSDERTDLAFLKLKDLAGRSLPALPLGDSDALEVGDLVLAIGNPFGVGQTVTMGIVSAIARTAVGISDYDFFIQTDAAVNPGNSGGALIDMKGRLVGINTAIYSRTGGSLGIGFAIPANMLRSMMRAAETGQPVVRPWLGADGQAVDRSLAEAYGLDRPAGILVNGVTAGGPAARAGLKVGDVVTAVDGHAVDDPESLRFRLATLDLGASAKLTVRRGKDTAELALPVEAPPETPARDQRVLGGRSPLAGATVLNVSPAVVEEMRLNGPGKGVVVTAVAARSPAARLGLQPGDVLLRLNDEAVESTAALDDALRGARGPWRIAIQRGGQVLETVVGR
ncbi:Do family serine endopeptidase [Inquilinus limosus]|uniref:Serine protease n=1 Tax=Inquilinus limosus TaxID=171674 RepID=A0A211ZJB3_9PROT|nr:Do family serine endopeptidase [Inquilinus limosus]OWJ65274.1 serine protease [Inquilinus limosus]